jgi:hypothetical protein
VSTSTSLRVSGEGRRARHRGAATPAVDRLIFRPELHARLGEIGDGHGARRHAAHADGAVDDLQILHRRFQLVGGDGDECGRQRLVLDLD